jgi:large subunit ribosomal protein L9
MKVVLLQDIKNVGRKGDIKDISEGYARNFILPKKLGILATTEAIVKVEMEKSAKAKLEKEGLEKSREIAKKLKDVQIELKVKEKSGKLFGSLHPKDIARELQNIDFDIPEKCIKIGEVIKKVGEYKIKIDLGNQISAEIILQVTGVK